VGHADEVQRGSRAGAQLRLAFVGAKDAFHRQVDVLGAGQPRQQRVVLEDHAAFRAGRGNLAAVAQQHPAGRLEQACDQVQQGALAAARMADQRDELTPGHAEVDVAQRVETTFPGLEHHLGVLDLDEVDGVLVNRHTKTSWRW
jgi:hypothetical protein